MKAIEQYAHECKTVYTLYKVVRTGFKAVDETPVCDHSNESYCAVSSLGTVFMLYIQSGSSSGLWLTSWANLFKAQFKLTQD